MTNNEGSILPRYEFRSFGRDFEKVGNLMKQLSNSFPQNTTERLSEEIYIVHKGADINNTKIRDGKLDIKIWVQNTMGLQQWRPLMKSEFPIAKNTLINEVFPALEIKIKPAILDKINLNDFLKIINNNPELQAVKVTKKRLGFLINNTICEFGEVQINNKKLHTINSESIEIDHVLKTMHDLGIESIENINYLQAIKRILGWVNKPLAN